MGINDTSGEMMKFSLKGLEIVNVELRGCEYHSQKCVLSGLSILMDFVLQSLEDGNMEKLNPLVSSL